ncbi:MAG: hypothetical protein QM611_00425 [Microbacterium sp.]|uniref:hypothetical protein n=1 Tax=Microbacterium sp. TaxID=51671 RepID=UPI0039E39438
MNFDTLSVTAMTALVVMTAGVVFVLETLVRRDEGAGRIWSLAFIAGMLTTISYLIWAADSSTWWAVAVGNGSFVASTGFVWLGCRRYNGYRVDIGAITVVAASLAAYFAVLAEGPNGGTWAGAATMFAMLALLGGFGAVQALRGEMGGQRTSWGLAFVMAAECVYYAVRLVVFVTLGPDHPVYQQWFDTVGSSFVTIPLVIVALVVTSVLRAGRADLRGFARRTTDTLGSDGILPHRPFVTMLEEIVSRAQWRQELVAVIAVRIEDLEQISTAFGSEVARSVRDAWRRGVRRYPPSNAIAGEDGLSGLLLCITAESPAEARRQAALVYRGVFEDLGAVAGGVIPVVGVGVALTSTFGYDSDQLVRAARGAAEQATISVESSVLVGEAERSTTVSGP